MTGETTPADRVLLRVTDGAGVAPPITGGSEYTIMVGRTGNPSRAAMGLDDPALPAVAFSITADDLSWRVDVSSRLPYEVHVTATEPVGETARVTTHAAFTARCADVSVWTPSHQHRVVVEWMPSDDPLAGRPIDRQATRLASRTAYSDAVLDVEVPEDRALVLACHLRVEHTSATAATDREILALIGHPDDDRGRNRSRIKRRIGRALPIVCDRQHGMEPAEYAAEYGRLFTRHDAVEYLVRAGLVDRTAVERAVAIEHELREDGGPW